MTNSARKRGNRNAMKVLDLMEQYMGKIHYTRKKAGGYNHETAQAFVSRYGISEVKEMEGTGSGGVNWALVAEEMNRATSFGTWYGRVVPVST